MYPSCPSFLNVPDESYQNGAIIALADIIPTAAVSFLLQLVFLSTCYLTSPPKGRRRLAFARLIIYISIYHGAALACRAPRKGRRHLRRVRIRPRLASNSTSLPSGHESHLLPSSMLALAASRDPCGPFSTAGGTAAAFLT